VRGRTAELEAIGDALRRPDLVGAVLSGATGTGKSTILHTACERARGQGFEVVLLHANRAMSTIPLFVFSAITEGDEEGDTKERFMAIKSALRSRSDHRPLLIAVDDAHELDDASAVLISQLARDLTAFVIASVRSSEPTPEPIAALWTQGIAVRVDVGPLGREATDEVAEELLGGPVDPALASELWRRSAGNPLHLRELIVGSRAAGVVAEIDGVWSRQSDLVISSALIDLVRQRIAALTPAEQVALCAVALAEPAEVALISAVADGDALVSLEEQDLVVVDIDRRRLQVRLVHPIYGEAVRSLASQIRVRSLREAMARTIAGWGSGRADDAIRLATWQLDANDIDPGSFAVAALEAIRRHDTDLAERLAAAAHDADPSALSARALAMTRYLLGRHGDALAVLDPALEREVDAVEIGRLRLLRGLVLARGLGEYHEAIEVLEAVDDTASPGVRRRARAMLGLISLLQGQATTSLRAATALMDEAVGDAEAATAFVGAMAATGRAGTAVAFADEFVSEHGMPDPRTLFPDFRWAATIDAGLVRQMEGEIGAAWTTAVEDGDRHQQARLAFAMGHVLAELGQAEDALAWFERSLVLSRSVGEPFGVRWALAGQLLVAAQDGDTAAADRVEEALASVADHPAKLFEIYGRRGSAWNVAAHGDPAQAAADLLRLAEELLAEGCVTHAVRSLADAARLGDAVAALEVLERTSPEVDGDLMPRLAALIRSLAAEDPTGAVAVADALEAMGYRSLAAGAVASARTLLQRAGRAREANALAGRIAPPASNRASLVDLLFAGSEVAVQLTRREREIAHLVTDGLTSREVAESLFLSVRTVDNHLSRIYDKLGIRSRTELADALAPTVVASAS
jgi:DNA-binding NarL/FixJ family response regulator